MSFLSLINFSSRIYLPLGRITIFVIYFWFGFLKILGLSPAGPLVEELLNKTLPFVAFSDFILLFGVYETIIGLVFLFPKLDRVSIWLFFAHMVMAALPLFVLPGATWQQFLVPTLEGQYIIKNLGLVAIVFGIIASLKRRPVPKS